MKKDRPKPVTTMIARIAKDRECTESDAIEYMLTVATGRLMALGRYNKSIPDGKENKGVLARKKKSAPRSKSIKIVESEAATAK